SWSGLRRPERSSRSREHEPLCRLHLGERRMTNLPASSLLDAEAEPAYDPTVPQSARNLVDFHLRQLGLGEQYVRTPSGLARVLPDGIGWCRAQTLTEAAWPLGADLCVLVDWFP